MAAVESPSVAVVIPCFNHKRFLAGAIESAIAQTVPAREIIVVDDGSREDIRPVAAAFEGVRLIRQENRGLAAARNSGLEAATSEKLIFLDADDRLWPNAIQVGLECFRRNPDAAFVYGAHREVRGEESSRNYTPAASHRDLVRCNWVAMIATAMFDRGKLVQGGGFDESLAMCEDWDAYLRLSRAFPFATHDCLVADYVRHGSNASNDVDRLWKWIEAVRQKEWARGLDAASQLAWSEGEGIWRSLVGPVPGPMPLWRRAGRKAAGLVRKVRGG